MLYWNRSHKADPSDWEFGIRTWKLAQHWRMGEIWIGRWGLCWWTGPKDDPTYHSRSGE